MSQANIPKTAIKGSNFTSLAAINVIYIYLNICYYRSHPLTCPSLFYQRGLEEKAIRFQRSCEDMLEKIEIATEELSSEKSKYDSLFGDDEIENSDSFQVSCVLLFLNSPAFNSHVFYRFILYFALIPIQQA